MQHLFEEGINQLNMVCPILAFGQVHCKWINVIVWATTHLPLPLTKNSQLITI